MNKPVVSIFMIFSLLVLPACESTQAQKGTVIGGVLGGAIGTQVGKGNGRVAAIILGTLAGAALGNYVGGKMDDGDRYRSQQALEYNRINQPKTWVNPNSGTKYSVTPTKTYASNSGQPCREYTTTVYIDGRAETGRGNACRDSDGVWSIQ